MQKAVKGIKSNDEKIMEIKKIRNSILFIIAAILVYLIQTLTVFAKTVSTNDIYSYIDENISVEVNGVCDGGIYNKDVNVNLKACSGCNKMSIFIKVRYKNGEGEIKEIERVQKNVQHGEYNSSRQYSETGIYEIVFYAEREGGYRSNEEIICFAIDKKAPVVHINGVEDGQQYNCKKELSINVSESFCDNLSVNVEIKREDNTGHITVSNPTYICKAMNNTNIYNISDDGKYVVTVEAVDSCGNESKCISSFTIDRRAPDIEIYNDENAVTESQILSKSPEFSVVVKEEMYDGGFVELTLLKKKSKEIFEKVTSKKYQLTKETTKCTLPVNEEGIYILNITAKDALLNEATRVTYFTLDKRPPVIGYFSDFNEHYLKEFKLPENAKQYIKDMTNVSYHTYLNDKEAGSGSIKKDGKYILQIVAEDEAGNVSEEAIAFIIDNTKPTVIVSGLNTEGDVEKNSNIRLSLFDEEDYFETIYVNGRELMLNDNKNEAYIPILEYGKYEINVTAKDNADNEVVKTIVTNCNVLSGAPNITELSGNIKKLTKSAPKNSVNYFSKNNIENLATPLCIITSIITISLVIFAVFTFVDTSKKEC